MNAFIFRVAVYAVTMGVAFVVAYLLVAFLIVGLYRWVLRSR